MTARKNDAGRWFDRFTTPPNDRGQIARLYVVCPPGKSNTEAFCKELVRRAIERHVRGIASSDLTFKQFFLDVFMKEYPAARGLEPSSVAAYEYLVGEIACKHIGHLPIGDVDGGVVARLLAKLKEETKLDAAIEREATRAETEGGRSPGLSPTTIEKALTVLEYVLDWAEEANRARGMKLAAAVEQFFTARAELKQSSAALYRYHLSRHVVPHLGHMAIGKITDTTRMRLRETLAVSGRRTAVYVPGALKKDGSLKKPWEVARERRRGSKTASADDKRFKPQTLRNMVVNIKAVVRLAKERKHIAEIPKIDIPSVPEAILPPPYTADEARALIAAAATEQRQVMYTLSFDAGCRKSELLGLEWEQIDWEHHVIVFDRQRYRGITKQTKGKRKRKVGMTPELEYALRRLQAQHKGIGGYVFCDADGKPYEEHHLRVFEERDAAAAGLRKVRWHAKRHTFASLVIEAGVSLIGLQNLLGHASSRTSEGYVHTAITPFKSVLNDGTSISPHIPAQLRPLR